LDELFKAASGCLQWSPDVIWHTPICQIVLAIEGRYEFAINTNPFGGGKSDKPKSSKAKNEEQRKADMKAKNEVLALKFDMMQYNARHKNMDMT